MRQAFSVNRNFALACIFNESHSRSFLYLDEFEALISGYVSQPKFTGEKTLLLYLVPEKVESRFLAVFSQLKFDGDGYLEGQANLDFGKYLNNTEQSIDIEEKIITYAVMDSEQSWFDGEVLKKLPWPDVFDAMEEYLLISSFIYDSPDRISCRNAEQPQPAKTNTQDRSEASLVNIKIENLTPKQQVMLKRQITELVAAQTEVLQNKIDMLEGDLAYRNKQIEELRRQLQNLPKK